MLALEGRTLDRDGMAELLLRWLDRYPIAVDRGSVRRGRSRRLDRVRTRRGRSRADHRRRYPRRQTRACNGGGAELRSCNAVLIKVNQAGTLTEAQAALDAGKRSAFRHDRLGALRRDRGRLDRASRRRLERGADQGRLVRAQRAHGEVERGAAHRGGARRRSTLRWRGRVAQVERIPLATPLRPLGEFIARRPLLAALALVVLTLVTHAVILATPGFYSNDEWQKFDHIRLHGFADFARSYATLRPGPEFGYPVRPIGFLQQGVAAHWMQSAPFVSHLVSVLNHALVALAFVWVLLRARVPSATAGLAGALFVLSPLTSMATAWTAASFDQLYVLFLLLAAAAVLGAAEEGVTLRNASAMLLATGAALLSKETAIVAPGVVLLIGLLSRAAAPERFSWRPFALAFAVVLAPVVVYLLFRAPAIATSLAGRADPAYTPDLANVPGNAWHLFAYPFRVKLVEISATIYRSPWQPLAAGGVHLLLVWAVYRLFGATLVLAYVVGYFLFLLPVLPLPNPGTQCLYGAALAMSLALAATTLRLAANGSRLALPLLVVAGGALYAHDLVIQRQLYVVGACQAQFLSSVDALLARQQSLVRPAIIVVPQPGAPSRVAIRAVAAREAYAPDGRPLVVVEAPDQRPAAQTDAGGLRARMTPTCTLEPEIR